MKRTIIALSIASALLAIAYLGYQAMQPPAGVRIVGDSAKVTAYAMLDENAPRPTYVPLEPLTFEQLEWLGERGYEHVGFEPHTQLGFADTLRNRNPYFIGFAIYDKRE